MFYSDNTVTLNSAIAANSSGKSYTVSFDAGPSVYEIISQATQAGDGLVVSVLRGDNSVLASYTALPGAWVTGPNAQNLRPFSFNYTGDGSGDVRIKIATNNSGSGRFGGALDNLQVAPTSQAIPNAVGIQITAGAHDNTNIKMTVTNGVKYYVWAIK